MPEEETPPEISPQTPQEMQEVIDPETGEVKTVAKAQKVDVSAGRGPIRFGLRTLCDMGLRGGKKSELEVMFDHAVAMCTNDITDGPSDPSVRKVALILEMKPNMNRQGNLDTISHKYQVKYSTPTLRSSEFKTVAFGESGQMFEPASPNDPRQAELPFPDKAK